MSKTTINIASEIKNPGKAAHAHLESEIADLSICGRRLVAEMPLSIDISYCYDGEGGVNTDGKIHAVFRETCARCGKEFPLHFECDFSERFIRLGRDDMADSDADDYTFIGEVIDLSDLIRDTVLLDFPSAAVCADDCKGLCSICGCDLNVTQCSCASEQCRGDDNGDDDENILAEKLQALQNKFSK